MPCVYGDGAICLGRRSVGGGSQKRNFVVGLWRGTSIASSKSSSSSQVFRSSSSIRLLVTPSLVEGERAGLVLLRLPTPRSLTGIGSPCEIWCGLDTSRGCELIVRVRDFRRELWVFRARSDPIVSLLDVEVHTEGRERERQLGCFSRSYG